MAHGELARQPPTDEGDEAADGASSKSESSMKYQKESTRSYGKSSPKLNHNTQVNNSEDNGAAVGSSNSRVPYRGFGNNGTLTAAAPAVLLPTRLNLGTRLRNLFGPRDTGMQLLLSKLDTQFSKLDMRMQLEQQKDEYDGSGVNDRDNPTHPLNNSDLMSDIHFVGRSAIDSSIVELSNFLTKRDTFGCITELWLNNNLISDDGAVSLAAFLQLPSCALVELWMGDNRIGAAGTSEIAAALSTNEYSKLKCLGLYKNPIKNGGASCLAQMLRVNHTLTTVDVHGCLYEEKKNSSVIESYGCRVVTANDGTVVTNPEERVGDVTDQRLIEAIKTFAAFNRINPTREQAIRGLSSSSVNAQPKLNSSTKNEKQHHKIVSTFLSDLCNQPPNETLTNCEKRKWKECEWERLYVEIERTRAAARAVNDRLQIKPSDIINEVNFFDNEDGEKSRKSINASEDFEKEMLGRDLDDEVVHTVTKSWTDLKIGISGCPSPGRKNVVGTKPGGGRPLVTTFDVVVEVTPPQRQLVNADDMLDEVRKQGLSDASLRLMQMVDYLEKGQKCKEANLDINSQIAENDLDDDENEVEVSSKIKVDSTILPLSQMSSLGSNNNESMIRNHRRSESTDQYEKSFESSKATLTSALDFLKELDSDPQSMVNSE